MSAFILIVGVMIGRSAFVIDRLGLAHLFSTDFYANGYLYGLLPCITGSALAVLITLVISLPVSLSLAILSSQFTVWPLSRLIRVALGALTGVPPIVYALTSVVFATLVFQPKFCGWGLPREAFPLPGMTWWDPGILPLNTSTLLGGMMLSLLVVPFVAPLMDDALRNVPGGISEASAALGASRWHTLVHATLPAAVPSLVPAGALGALKALGDVVIVAWAVGYLSEMPVPILDVFSSTGPLTSAGAAIVGGFTWTEPEGFARSVGYFIGLVLLLGAVFILALSSILQARLLRRRGL